MDKVKLARGKSTSAVNYVFVKSIFHLQLLFKMRSLCEFLIYSPSIKCAVKTLSAFKKELLWKYVSIHAVSTFSSLSSVAYLKIAYK